MNKLTAILLTLVLVMGFGVMSALATTSQITVLDGTYTEIYNVTFGADDDITHSVTHGLGVEPELVSLAPWSINCSAVSNMAGILNSGMPYVSSTSTTAIVIDKPNSTRSASCVVRVTIQRVHSIQR